MKTPGGNAAKAEEEIVSKAATAASVFFMGTSFQTPMSNGANINERFKYYYDQEYITIQHSRILFCFYCKS